MKCDKLRYRESHIFQGEHFQQLVCVAFSLDGRYIAIGGKKQLAICTLGSFEIKVLVSPPPSRQLTTMEWAGQELGTLVCGYKNDLTGHSTVCNVVIRQVSDYTNFFCTFV